MAKAVLVMVMEMPESCDMCDFVDDEQPTRYGEKTLYCGVPGVGEEVTDYIACRPDWCPLRELPEKKAPDNELALSPMLKGHIYEYERGCNACLDAIDK